MHGKQSVGNRVDPPPPGNFPHCFFFLMRAFLLVMAISASQLKKQLTSPGFRWRLGWTREPWKTLQQCWSTSTRFSFFLPFHFASWSWSSPAYMWQLGLSWLAFCSNAYGRWIYILDVGYIYWWYEICFVHTHLIMTEKADVCGSPDCPSPSPLRSRQLWARTGLTIHSFLRRVGSRLLHRWLSTERAGRRDFSCQRGRRSRWTRDFHEK